MPQDQDKDFDPIKAEFMTTGVGDYLPLASAAKGIYDAFVKCGFPDERAYDMTRAWLVQMCANMKNGGK